MIYALWVPHALGVQRMPDPVASPNMWNVVTPLESWSIILSMLSVKMTNVLAGTGCPKKLMPSVERRQEYITGRIR